MAATVNQFLEAERLGISHLLNPGMSPYEAGKLIASERTRLSAQKQKTILSLLMKRGLREGSEVSRQFSTTLQWSVVDCIKIDKLQIHLFTENKTYAVVKDLDSIIFNAAQEQDNTHAYVPQKLCREILSGKYGTRAKELLALKSMPRTKLEVYFLPTKTLQQIIASRPH